MYVKGSKLGTPRTRYDRKYIAPHSCITYHASSANDKPTLGFFFTFLAFDAGPPPPSPSSSPRALPTALRLAVIGLDLEADPEEAEENERLVFSLASCFFALDSFASPDAASDESCSGGRPFAWIGKKEGEGVEK